jgi:uncharacterized protein (UPF0332 family)
MSFDWSHYLTVARIFCDEAPGKPLQEALYRIAISRAYYALYCSTRNKMRSRMKFSKSASAHKKLADELQKSSNRDKRLIGTWLQRYRIKRNRADYDDSYVSKAGLETDAKLSVLAVQRALKMLD